MSSTVETTTEIRPFHVDIPQEELDELRRRIGATRWPSRELVEDRSQGVQLEALQELARYWATEYEWRKAEARLNALPQFTTEIDGVDIALYWLTGTGASAARSYWENGQAQARATASGQAQPEVSLPVGFTQFPGEIFRAPRSWVEQGYSNVTYFNEADRGGHFAAWEEPELFSEEIRAAFRPLR